MEEIVEALKHTQLPLVCGIFTAAVQMNLLMAYCRSSVVAEVRVALRQLIEAGFGLGADVNCASKLFAVLNYEGLVV